MSTNEIEKLNELFPRQKVLVAIFAIETLDQPSRALDIARRYVSYFDSDSAIRLLAYFFCPNHVLASLNTH